MRVVLIMRLSLLCPTYPKSGQVGDFVGGLYQDLSRGLGICTMSFGTVSVANFCAYEHHSTKIPIDPLSTIGDFESKSCP